MEGEVKVFVSTTNIENQEKMKVSQCHRDIECRLVEFDAFNKDRGLGLHYIGEVW